MKNNQRIMRKMRIQMKVQEKKEKSTEGEESIKKMIQKQ